MLQVSGVAGVSVRASPGAETWAGLALARFERTTKEQRDERAQLGLPTDRPVIMTGHQAGFWHPGIFAKYIAADRLARSIGGVAAAVVVDHDVVDPVRVSAVRTTADDAVEAVAVHLRARSGGPTLSRLERPLGSAELSRAAFPTGLVGSDRAALERIVGALDWHGDTASLAEQVDRANAELLDRWIGVASFTAQRLVRTTSWKSFFAMAVRDAASCVRAYNRAVLKHPEAGIGPLFAMDREERWELPFWLLDREKGRRPLYAEMVEQPMFDPDLLATKALSLTASLRRGLCDLFIHGTGGAVYDRAADDWIGAWLGEDLAPSVAITADVYRRLPVEAQRDATEDARDRAVWKAHSARHNPGLLGDTTAAAEKRAMLDRIEQAPRDSVERLELYRAMHERLAEVRKAHREELNKIDTKARSLERGLAVRELECRRDWPSVFYPKETLDELASVIGASLGAVARP